MKARFLYLWDAVRSSFWFVPALMILGAFATALVMVQIDLRFDERFIESFQWIEMSPPAARSILSSIAGAMVTSAGVVFSITIVALSIAASQFGPRLIRTYRTNPVTHVTLGVFIATSLYCFVVLAAVRDLDGVGFVPLLSVYLSIVLAILCLCILIYFIHNAAVSIQAPNVVNASACDLDETIERLFPEKLGHPPPEEAPGDSGAYQRLDADCHVIESDKEGYIQAIDPDGLMHTAIKNNLVIELLLRPGEFVTRNTTLANAWGRGELSDETTRQIAASFITATDRTPRQDIEYAINELVEIAVRALSPGINDPFTAITCVDRLGAALGRFAGRKIPSAWRYDPESQLRIVGRPATFPELLDAAFDKIRQHARGDFSVSLHLLRCLESLARRVQREVDQHAVLCHAEMVNRGCLKTLTEPRDAHRAARQYGRVVSLLNGSNVEDEVRVDSSLNETAHRDRQQASL